MLCRAKVNLTLHVGAPFSSGKWSGYHPVESLVVFADIGDELRFATGDRGHDLSIDGPFSEGLNAGADNLVSKALERCDAPPTHAILTKNVPVSAGLGGGSANAAAVLRAFGNDGNGAAALGADVPVCYLSETVMMEGIGERVTPLSGLGRLPAVLVNPGRPVSTGAIFNAFDATHPRKDPARTARTGSLLTRALSGSNDLQPVAIGLEPSIQEVLDALDAQQGCQLARMSGSGATCFGLFQTEAEAREAAHTLSRSGWWSVFTWLGETG